MQNPPPPTSSSSSPSPKKQRKPRMSKGEGLAAPGTKLKRAKASFVRAPPPSADIVGGAVSKLRKRRLNRAHKLGMQLQETYKRHNIKIPHKLIHGEGFWSDFADGFRKGFGHVASVAKHIPFGVGSAYGKVNDAVQATK